MFLFFLLLEINFFMCSYISTVYTSFPVFLLFPATPLVFFISSKIKDLFFSNYYLTYLFVYLRICIYNIAF